MPEYQIKQPTDEFLFNIHDSNIAKLQIKAPPEIHVFHACMSKAMDATEAHAMEVLTYTPKFQISASLKMCLHPPSTIS